jgi:glucose/mannose transport system substrate-binding protein
MKKILVAGIVLLLFLAGATVLFAGGQTGEEEAKEFIIFHYWTAGGEKEAIEALYKIFLRDNPWVKILENPVAGGGGANMLAVLMANLESGNPPDAFQDHQGNKQKAYVDAGYLEPVNDIWQKTNFEGRVNAAWVKTLKFGGNVYSVPINAHRSNWLWYNVGYLKDAGAKPPESYDELLTACKKVKAVHPDVSPIALGTRGGEKIWSTYLYDMCLLNTGGPDFYERANTGQIDFTTDSTFRKAMSNYAALIPYIYPYHATKSWDEAGALIHTGESAMYWMGDWVLGYYLSIGMEPGKDFDATAMPKNVWMGHADTFPLAKNAPHPELARYWIEMCTTTEAQKDFNMIKGSVTIVNDVSADVYPDPFRKRSAKDLASLRGVIDGYHGGMMTSAFGDDLSDILTQFLTDSDVDSAIKEIAGSAERNNIATANDWFWKK